MCDSMRVNKYAYFQLSYLYTDKANTRCVRVVTKRVRVGTPIQFFQSIHPKPLIALAAKKLCFALRRNADIQSAPTTIMSFDAARAMTTTNLNSNAPFESTSNALYGQLFNTLAAYCKLTAFTSV